MQTNEPAARPCTCDVEDTELCPRHEMTAEQWARDSRNPDGPQAQRRRDDFAERQADDAGVDDYEAKERDAREDM